MKIQHIDNTSFGYNKKLNSELKAKLKENNKDIDTDSISTLNDFCNKTEDLVRFYASVQNDDREEELYDAFAFVKLSLAKLVEEKYPELNYTEREHKTYNSEAGAIMKKGKDLWPWQFAMANELESYISKNEADEKDIDNDISGKGNPPPANDSDQRFYDRVDKIKNAIKENKESTPDVVERFVPTLSSPKGFESLGGMKELKEELMDKIIYPALHPEEAALDWEEYGKRYPRGIMLYGPPGCGKTFIVEALSQEAELPLFKLKISKAGSKFINETSENYEKAFQYVAECAQMAGKPCILFIDEVDGMTKGRSNEASSEDLKQMGTLLNLIETARDRNIIVVAATNKYDIVDEAIRRRFDGQVYVGLPDSETREEILYNTLGQWLKGIPLAETPEDLKEIADKTNGFPSSALVILSDKASTRARKDGRRIITKEDFFVEIENNRNLMINEKNYQSEKARTPIGFAINKK